MKYIYYTLYRLIRNIKTNDTPHLTAMFLISLCEAINVQSALLYFPQSIENQFVLKYQLLIFAITPCLIFYWINYNLYVKRLPEIIEEYKNDSDTRKNIGVILLVSYIIGTCVFAYIANVKR
jgi:Kef-type K+ transport system membrane component KefB